MTDFNPRSPCGERPQRHASHSPRADFNPRSPCGERLFSSMYEDGLPLFQSALPLRGATKASENASCNAIFQSALPLRGATSSRPVRGTSYIFQSALPLRGATRESPRCTCCRGISIRAPLAGSDVESGFRFRSRDDFNPRSPCGERHRFFGSCEDIVIFQSALPLRGATLHLVTLEGGHEISIRAPLAGSDLHFVAVGVPTVISIRAPLAGSDDILADVFAFVPISIRAPLAGSDALVRGFVSHILIISIRAPLAGSDIREKPRRIRVRDFNPRSPCGERRRGCLAAPDTAYFNPRSPCGERPLHFVASIYYQQSVVFSKTVAANSVDKLRKTTAKSAITRCEPRS